MAKNKHKKLFTLEINSKQINMEVNESNYNHFQSLSPGCNLQSGRCGMRADRAAGTEKSAVRLSMCAGTWLFQSRFSSAHSERNCRAL